MSFTSLWEMEWQRLKGAVLSDPFLRVQDMQLYGSRVSGFDENSDVDATVLVHGRDALPVLQMLEEALPRLLPYVEVLERIYTARVPILRLRGNGLEFDLSVNNILPIWNTRLLKGYADLEPRAVTLVKAVKRWAKGAEVVGAPSGNLSSYSLTLMAIYYAQIRGALPVLQGEHVIPYMERGCNVAFGLPPLWNKDVAKELSFSDFVRFYATEYEWGRECVSVRRGRRSDISFYSELQLIQGRKGVSTDEWKLSIRIEDPIETSRDLADVLRCGRSTALRAAFLAEQEVLDAGRRAREE